MAAIMPREVSEAAAALASMHTTPVERAKADAIYKQYLKDVKRRG